MVAAQHNATVSTVFLAASDVTSSYSNASVTCARSKPKTVETVSSIFLFMHTGLKPGVNGGLLRLVIRSANVRSRSDML
jgi:hypothetical protein